MHTENNERMIQVQNHKEMGVEMESPRSVPRSCSRVTGDCGEFGNLSRFSEPEMTSVGTGTDWHHDCAYWALVMCQEHS